MEPIRSKDLEKLEVSRVKSWEVKFDFGVKFEKLKSSEIKTNKNSKTVVLKKLNKNYFSLLKNKN